MLGRKKSKKIASEMSPEEMHAEVRQSASQALVFAKQGDVAAMETMLEHAAQLAEQIEQRLPRAQADQIKRLGYQKGIEILQEQIAELTEDQDQEKTRLQQLVYSYQGELLDLPEGDAVR